MVGANSNACASIFLLFVGQRFPHIHSTNKIHKATRSGLVIKNLSSFHEVLDLNVIVIDVPKKKK